MVSRHGEPDAVLISVGDLDALEETLEILADAELVRAIQQSLRSTTR